MVRNKLRVVLCRAGVCVHRLKTPCALVSSSNQYDAVRGWRLLTLAHQALDSASSSGHKCRGECGGLLHGVCGETDPESDRESHRICPSYPSKGDDEDNDVVPVDPPAGKDKLKAGATVLGGPKKKTATARSRPTLKHKGHPPYLLLVDQDIDSGMALTPPASIYWCR